MINFQRVKKLKNSLTKEWQGMGKSGMVLAGIAGVFLLAILMAWGSYNGMVTGRNAVDKSWSDVEAAYQRRLDTIPKFAQTAQFSADFQIKLQQTYVQGREGLSNAAASKDPGTLQAAANDKYNAMLIAVRQEAVPEAKTTQLTELNAEIENVERVINHERDAYNSAVQGYDNSIQTFPGAVFANAFGFTPRKGFQADAGAEKSPTINLKLGS